MRATLAIEPAPELGEGVQRYVLDCRHMTTRALLQPGQTPVSGGDVLKILILSHDQAAGCRCTAYLWRNRSTWSELLAPATVMGRN